MESIFQAKVLVVDDNPALLELLGQTLTDAGYPTPRTADCAAGARQILEEFSPDLIILDVNLPDGDGFSLFQQIRSRWDGPILFLSARDADSDRLFGLGLGADDYLTKPFLTQELLLRIQLILRRFYRQELHRPQQLVLGSRRVDFQDATVTGPEGCVHLTATERQLLQKLLDYRQELHRPQQLVLGSRRVDFQDATVTGPEGCVHLTATERQLLQKLLDNRGHIVTYDALCEAVWSDGYYGYV